MCEIYQVINNKPKKKKQPKNPKKQTNKKTTTISTATYTSYVGLDFILAVSMLVASRGVARTVVMCRHLNETVGGRGAPWGHLREIFEK